MNASAAPFPYDGPEALREPLTQAMRQVMDPEVALSIVDVGLVYGVAVTPERLHVSLTMTSMACPVADVIVDDVLAELDRVAPEGLPLQVELVWEPPWTPERMSPYAKTFMGW
ncbi:metal-sulfur cluster assembly factor [Pelomonas sp. P7]|uniref:Metal-sulfur cluster assembly factor n=1 Tax=Pelomonas caseinilytica TaxID=2906763 RepID=A0ABS8XEH4_9BURK|nr:metal-sulfur cluster assembly factor [Pelomonas sp. P7]MCE4537862.1 metal-sulfur cluster assembly factor [Pelomonas sp. P7]